MSKPFTKHPLFPRVEAAYFSGVAPSSFADITLTWDEFVTGIADGTYLPKSTVTSLMVAPHLTDSVREHYPHLVAGQDAVRKFLQVWQHGKFQPGFGRYYSFFSQGTKTSFYTSDNKELAIACGEFAAHKTPHQFISEARKQGYTWQEVAEGARLGIALEYLSELRAA